MIAFIAVIFEEPTSAERLSIRVVEKRATVSSTKSYTMLDVITKGEDLGSSNVSGLPVDVNVAHGVFESAGGWLFCLE